MKESVTIRPATLNDLPTLLQFEQGLVLAERPMDVTIKRTDTHYYDIPHMITVSYIELLVAEIRDELVGCGYARIEDAKLYLRHAKHAYFGFMYVKPEYRGKGINHLIMEALKNWSVSKEITELRLDVYFLNESAIKAYEKAGFSKHMVEMRCAIG